MPPVPLPADPVAVQLRQACAELERRLQAGENCRAEGLLEVYPSVAADDEAALDLIYTEYVLRQRLGQQPDENQWYSRFPRHQDELRRIFRFHALLDGNSPPPSTNVSRRTPPAGVGLFHAPPPTLGKYDLLEEIGRGGMGVVYRARQRGLDRLVALKLILSGELASPEEVARFRTEALAAASLQHPNLVQVIEVGEEHGQHFLAMEYVDGPSLEKHLAGTPTSLREAAHLVETLARAIQHAHDRGIVHRDLKPANILLQDDLTPRREGAKNEDEGHSSLAPSRLGVSFSTPKITDFGLAKRLHAVSGPTHTNAIVGTPSYMPPEQTQGDRDPIGPRADIYALGAILYECLTGRPPFKGENAMDTLLQVRNQEPVPPRRLRLSVPRDLETICLKCLAKEPAKRYASATALANDLAAWRDGRPIQARPISWWEQGVKWARRQPVVAGLLALCLVLLAGLIGGGVWHIHEQNLELTRTKEQYNRAEENLNKGTELVDDFLNQLANTGMMHIPGLDTFVQELLEKALEYRKGFLQQHGTDATLRERVGLAYQQVGHIYLLLRRDEEAEQTLRQSVAYFTKLVEDHPESRDDKQRLITSLYNLSKGLSKRPKGEKEAIEVLRQATQLQQELAAADSAERRYRLDLARHYFGLGNLLHQARDFKGADQNYRDALHLRQALRDEAPEEPEYQYELARSHQDLAVFHRDLGIMRRDPTLLRVADQHYLKALSLLEPLMRKRQVLPAYREVLAVTHTNRGNLLKLLPEQRFAEAEQHYQQALTHRTRLVEEYRERPQYRHQLAITLLQLGDLQLKRNRRSEGEALLRESLKHRQTLTHVHANLVENHNEIGKTAHLLADVLRNRHRAAEAAALLREAIHHQEMAVNATPRADWATLLDSHRRILHALLERTLSGTTGI